MNFRSDLAVAVMAGRKTVTRRLVSDNPRSPWYREQCAYRVGQVVAVCPGRGEHQIGQARIVSVDKAALIRLSDEGARAEGFASADDFEAAWRQINGAYELDALVWRIGLEAVSESACPAR